MATTESFLMLKFINLLHELGAVVGFGDGVGWGEGVTGAEPVNYWKNLNKTSPLNGINLIHKNKDFVTF